MLLLLLFHVERVVHLNRIVCSHLTIDSIRSKFEQLNSMITGTIDLIIITETKLDETFPHAQFCMGGFSNPYRLDRFGNGGGILIYIREDIPSKSLDISPISNEIEIESIFIEINLRNRKLLLGGTYIPYKMLAPLHLENIGNTLNLYLEKYDNILLMGDYNCEVVENAMHVFCETYNLKNLIKVPTFQISRQS